jgi:hypothetical protein
MTSGDDGRQSEHHSKLIDLKLIPAPWARDKLRLHRVLEKGRKNAQA